MKTSSPEIGFITSFRKFSRDTEIRKKALKTRQPIIVEDKKSKDFFFLVPPEMYKGLREIYEDWKDSELLKKEISEDSEDSKNWKDFKNELLKP